LYELYFFAKEIFKAFWRDIKAEYRKRNYYHIHKYEVPEKVNHQHEIKTIQQGYNQFKENN